MFNRKTKAKIKELEKKLFGFEHILKLILKCDICGDKAPMRICRKHESSNGIINTVDSLLCEKCLERENKDDEDG